MTSLRFSWWHLLVSAALAALGFFLLFSSAGVSLSLAALVVLTVARPRVLWRAKPWTEPVVAVGLALLAYIIAHTLWMTGLQAATLQTVNRYHELLLVPILLAALRNARHRRVFTLALVAGALFLAALHCMALVVPALGPVLESRRISAGFGLAIVSFLILVHARGTARPWPARAVAAFLALTVLFAVHGRTGHLVLLLLVACAAWLHSPPRWRWAAVVASPLLVIALAMSSGAVNGRLGETMAGSQASGSAGPMSSTAIRMELISLGIDLSRQHWATGAGFANYAAIHEEAAKHRYSQDPINGPRLLAGWERGGNPHNEYVMQLVGGGVFALALFLAWLGVTMAHALRAPVPVGGMLGGTCLAFATGCLVNSLLMDFTEGHFYMGVLALLLAQSRYGPRQQGRAQPVRSILVVATRQIGDVLLTTPLVLTARRRWPQARIDVLGFQGTLGMLRGNADVNELIETPPRLGWRGLSGLVRRLWRHYDLALVTDTGDRAHLMGWIAAPRRCGIVAPEGGSNWWKKSLLDHAVVSAGDLGGTHVTVEKLALLRPWLDEAQAPPPRVVVPRGTPLPDVVRAQLRAGAVIVHAPSMWPYKQWPLSHFKTLVEALLALDRQVVLTGSGSARDQECIAALRGLAPSPQLLDLSGQLDFNQLVTLFESAALYIGPDTSVSHLAAAAGIPVIAIFGPTNPLRWAPWPARASTQALFARSALVQHAGNVVVLQGKLPCVPCGRAGCEDHRQSRSDCLVDITPQRVLEEAVKTLSEKNACVV